jgi:hypothetical protein
MLYAHRCYDYLHFTFCFEVLRVPSFDDGLPSNSMVLGLSGCYVHTTHTLLLSVLRLGVKVCRVFRA